MSAAPAGDGPGGSPSSRVYTVVSGSGYGKSVILAAELARHARAGRQIRIIDLKDPGAALSASRPAGRPAWREASRRSGRPPARASCPAAQASGKTAVTRCPDPASRRRPPGCPQPAEPGFASRCGLMPGSSRRRRKPRRP